MSRPLRNGAPNRDAVALPEDAQRFLRAVAAHGYAPHDPPLLQEAHVRDAAHEAFHALSSGVAKPWTRERVHRALTRSCRRYLDLWLSELRARVVEQHVCVALSCDPGGTLEDWICASAIEAIRLRDVPYSNPDDAMKIVERMKPHAAELAAPVLALLNAKEG